MGSGNGQGAGFATAGSAVGGIRLLGVGSVGSGGSAGSGGSGDSTVKTAGVVSTWRA